MVYCLNCDSIHIVNNICSKCGKPFDVQFFLEKRGLVLLLLRKFGAIARKEMKIYGRVPPKKRKEYEELMRTRLLECILKREIVKEPENIEQYKTLECPVCGSDNIENNTCMDCDYRFTPKDIKTITEGTPLEEMGFNTSFSYKQEGPSFQEFTKYRNLVKDLSTEEYFRIYSNLLPLRTKAEREAFLFEEYVKELAGDELERYNIAKQQFRPDAATEKRILNKDAKLRAREIFLEKNRDKPFLLCLLETYVRRVGFPQVEDYALIDRELNNETLKNMYKKYGPSSEILSRYRDSIERKVKRKLKTPVVVKGKEKGIYTALIKEIVESCS